MPIEVNEMHDRLLDLQSGDSHVCVRGPKGTVVMCWGMDLFGQSTVPADLSGK